MASSLPVNHFVKTLVADQRAEIGIDDTHDVFIGKVERCQAKRWWKDTRGAGQDDLGYKRES